MNPPLSEPSHLLQTGIHVDGNQLVLTYTRSVSVQKTESKGSNQPLPVECPDFPVAIHMSMIAVACSQTLYQENISTLCERGEMYMASLQ